MENSKALDNRKIIEATSYMCVSATYYTHIVPLMAMMLLKCVMFLN